MSAHARQRAGHCGVTGFLKQAGGRARIGRSSRSTMNMYWQCATGARTNPFVPREMLVVMTSNRPILLKPLQVGKCFTQRKNTVEDVELWPEYGIGELEASHPPLKPFVETNEPLP